MAFNRQLVKYVLIKDIRKKVHSLQSVSLLVFYKYLNPGYINKILQCFNFLNLLGMY